MALDLDHPIHQMMLRWSQRIGIAWPPDPYLGALARCKIMTREAELLSDDLDVKLRELEAARVVVDRLQSEARSIRDDHDRVVSATLYMLSEAAREKPHSPWSIPLTGPHPFARMMTRTKR